MGLLRCASPDPVEHLLGVGFWFDGGQIGRVHDGRRRGQGCAETSVFHIVVTVEPSHAALPADGVYTFVADGEKIGGCGVGHGILFLYIVSIDSAGGNTVGEQAEGDGLSSLRIRIRDWWYSCWVRRKLGMFC